MAELPRVVILGSASVVPDEDHENSHMVLLGESGAIMIDCTGRPLSRLKKVGVSAHDLDALILTHFHPDHVGAVPNLLLSAWIIGRKRPLHIYGLHHCLQRLEDLMSFYHWENWSGFFPVVFHHLPQRESIPVLENADFTISASPVRHYVPTIGVRVECRTTNFVLGYSSDTIPCPETVRLAHRADLLIHEATGNEPLGHSSASQAGAIACEAEARRLGLIHYPVWEATADHLVAEAQSTFDGPVFLCEDYMEIPLRA
ncbi:MAG: MBL fold metallo-hydrolase [Anaerolineae bacterium]|nr:MBL fold metallo-hydrolase [Anaerolineae bacterium]